MAIMIPNEPREYKELSLEGEMFDALSSLPDDYYVIHSLKNVFVKDNTVYEGETDFVVLNPQYGMICIEAKAGSVKYQDGYWMYQSGKLMKHGGPYNQAALNKWDLIEKIKLSELSDILKRCKFFHAVWFPSISNKDLYTNRFPAEFDRNITMTKEDLKNPKEAIEAIYKLELPYNKKTNLSDDDVKRLLREFICPEFDIFPSSNFDIELKNITFNRLLDEQKRILNYLIEQKSAVINGAAGTGKTMIAVEKATRHAENGERVLFLCYNSYLKTYLESKFSNDNIDFLTIDGFACKICKTQTADYKMAGDKVIDMYLTGTFPYKHVIVDEGQDFGRDEIEEADLLQVIHDTVVENDEVDGTFYVFYDKLQLIQSTTIPKYIEDADCKLTLYKNCRNTENIALTSLKPITERMPKLYEGAIKGAPANIHFIENEDQVNEKMKSIIAELKQDGISDIVILTCKTENESILKPYLSDGKFKKINFTTCRKFKGLEADAVVLVDVDEETFCDDNVLRFYVGASRARLRLDIISTMDDDACSNVLNEVIRYKKKIKIPKREFAYSLNSLPNINID